MDSDYYYNIIYLITSNNYKEKKYENIWYVKRKRLHIPM